MAEAILKHKKLKNVEVRSAGIYALEGSQMSENSSVILDQENLAHQHSAHQINGEDVAWADLILTMTIGHKEMLIRNFEGAYEKTYTLKEYATPYSARDVFDPYGGDVTLYKQTFEELKQAIDELEEKIVMGEKNE